MKRILFLLLFFITLSTYRAQNVPAGVGSTSNNILWLDATSLSQSNGSPVSLWNDQSLNNNDATQSTPAFRPTYRMNVINGLPIVEFDGATSALHPATKIGSSDITTFMVYSTADNALAVPFHNDFNVYISTLNKIGIASNVPWNPQYVNRSNNTYSVFSGTHDTNNSSFTLISGNNVESSSSTGQTDRDTATIGAFYNVGNSGYFYHSQMGLAELIVYDIVMSSAERKIVSEYLATKYNLTSEANLYGSRGSHDQNLMGIGQEFDGSDLVAKWRDSLEVSNPSTMNDGDYFVVASDGGSYSTSFDVPAGITERWDISWATGITGTPGGVDMEFFLGSNSFAATSDYAILIEEVDGDFSNGGTRIHTLGLTYNAGSNSISFSNVTLNDGDVFTLAEVDGDISSVQDGRWKNPSTWSCSCIPDENSIVDIQPTHDITIDSNAQALRLSIASTASLIFSGSDTLAIHEDLLVDGTISAGNGTISAVGIAPTQLFENESGTRIDLYNLYVNNSNGLDIVDGGWSISNNLQVSAGGLDVSLADSIVLLSSSSKTSQILESMSNAFTGEFIVQRHIGSRNANFGNLSSPIQSATFNELDDDIYISGAGGIDGNANASGGGIFYSLYQFESRPDTHMRITNINQAMLSGRGYEVYLADNLSTFNATTVDFKGTPNSGSVQVAYAFQINKGWNLIGNPYHSFISWGVISIPQTSLNYYIFDTDAGSYVLKLPTDPIAPSQGFWVFQSNGGGYYPFFTEASKVNSTSSTFLRNSSKDNFKLSLHSLDNGYRHDARVKFNEYATESIDEFDVTLLPSPIETAPAIYSKIGYKEKLIENAINPYEDAHLIPFSIDAGIEGKYKISAENFDELQENYSCIYLQDKHTGEAIDLNLETTYEFTSREGEDDRFNLILSNSYTKCEELMKEDQSIYQEIEQNFKLRNSFDNWFVDYELGEDQSQVEVHIYNMNGQEVANPTYFNASDVGTYPIRGLEELDGIYMIQIRSNNQLINKRVKL